MLVVTVPQLATRRLAIQETEGGLRGKARDYLSLLLSLRCPRQVSMKLSKVKILVWELLLDLEAKTETLDSAIVPAAPRHGLHLDKSVSCVHTGVVLRNTVPS